MIAESHLRAETAILDVTVPATRPWSGIVKSGQTIRIVDLEGQQAVDTDAGAARVSAASQLPGFLGSVLVVCALRNPEAGIPSPP